MSRWRSTLASAFVLVLLWFPSYTAQTGTRADTSEAHVILQGKYKPDCTPERDLHAIILELNAIRKTVPAVSNIHATGRYADQQLLLSIAGLLSPSITEAQKASRIQEMTLHPLGTGIPKLDRLNRQFGAVRLERLFDDWISIQIAKPLDMFCVAEKYQTVLGTPVQPNYVIGDGDRIYRAEKPNEPIHYIIRIGSGDCPAGCTEEEVFYFNLYAQRRGFRIERVEAPQFHHSLWGYPARFPLRIFADFPDLLRQTASPDWSLRLHAVSAVGRVYARGTSGLGEDEDTDVVNRTSAIAAEIIKQRRAIEALLKERSSLDPDNDIRRVAKSALRSQLR